MRARSAQYGVTLSHLAVRFADGEEARVPWDELEEGLFFALRPSRLEREHDPRLPKRIPLRNAIGIGGNTLGRLRLRALRRRFADHSLSRFRVFRTPTSAALVAIRLAVICPLAVAAIRRLSPLFATAAESDAFLREAGPFLDTAQAVTTWLFGGIAVIVAIGSFLRSFRPRRIALVAKYDHAGVEVQYDDASTEFVTWNEMPDPMKASSPTRGRAILRELCAFGIGASELIALRRAAIAPFPDPRVALHRQIRGLLLIGLVVSGMLCSVLTLKLLVYVLSNGGAGSPPSSVYAFVSAPLLGLVFSAPFILTCLGIHRLPLRLRQALTRR